MTKRTCTAKRKGAKFVKLKKMSYRVKVKGRGGWLSIKSTKQNDKKGEYICASRITWSTVKRQDK